jgi:hypothetical protein
MATNIYNQPGAVQSSGTKTYSKKDFKAGKINPYNQSFSDEDPYEEQKKRQEADNAKSKQRTTDLASKTVKAQAEANAPKPKSFIQKTGSTISSGAKGAANLAKGVVEDTKKASITLGTGIARTLPGGTADLQAEQKASEQASRDTAKIKNLQKTGKITPVQASKLLKGSANSANEASKSVSDTYKELPSENKLKGSMLELGSFGVPGGGAAKVGSKVLPKLAAKVAVKRAEDGAGGAAVRAALRAVREAPMGATYGAGQAMTEDKNIIKGAAEGAALVGAAGAGASLIRSAAKGVKDLKHVMPDTKQAVARQNLEQLGDTAKGRMKLGQAVVKEAKTTRVPVEQVAEKPVKGTVKPLGGAQYIKEVAKLGRDHDKEMKGLKGKGSLTQQAAQEQIDRKYQALHDKLDADYGKTRVSFAGKPVVPPTVNAVVHPELIEGKIVKPEIATVPHKHLTLGSDTLHTKLDKQTVAKYVDDVNAGRPVSPVVISREKGGQILVHDGKHRLAAMKQAGVENIPVVEKTNLVERHQPTISELGGGREADSIQKQIEVAHNAGNSALVDKLIPQLPKDLQESTRNALGTLKPKPTPTAPLKPIGEGATKTSKLGASVQQKAIDKKLTDTLGDLPKYSSINMKEQAAYATELLASDEARAIRIARGFEVPPSNVLPESIYTAVENKALADGNIELLRQLAQSTRVGEATAMGQRIRALAERDPDSAVTHIRQISEARQAALEKRTKTSVAEAVQKTASEIKRNIKEPTKTDWNMFVESLKC